MDIYVEPMVPRRLFFAWWLPFNDSMKPVVVEFLKSF